MAKKIKVKAEVKEFDGKIEELILQALIEKKGVNIISIDLKKINHVFFDYFIVCTGSSKPHVETLCDFVQETTKRYANTMPKHVEGTSNGEWILLDYFNVVVHIFQPEAREYYKLDQLYNDAEITRF
ncbi:MAG: ribosome silencing factor [Bacteroidales bacterium]|nr:ribosome silencing factor [Bacteroidales bacterium]